MKELSKLSIELEINFKMDILKVSKAKARKEGIKMNFKTDILKITKAGKGGIKNESES